MKRLFPISCLLLVPLFYGCEQKHDDLASTEEVVTEVDLVIPNIDVAIAKGDLEAVKLLLESDPELVNKGQRPEMPPLLSALLRKKTDIARLLILEGADVNAADSSGRTAAHLVVERNLPELIPLLGESGADFDLLDNVGWTPLHWAAAKDQLSSARALIEAGADVHVISKLGGSMLHEAASSGSGDMVNLLLSAGVNPNIVANDGGYALDVANKFENLEAIALLKPVTEKKE